MAKIQSIYRYPIKGLSPEPLAQVALSPGETLPGDRLYAIENGPSPFDPVNQPYLPKTHFLMLMRNERLAALRTSFDHASHTLTISFPSSLAFFPSPLVVEGWEGKSPGSTGAENPSASAHRLPIPTPNRGPRRASAMGCPASPQGGGEISADLRTPEGRAAIEAFFARYCADELRGAPRVLHAPGHSFSDVARKVVSFINLASVAAIEDMVGTQVFGAKVNPLRFRGNVYVEGWPAWSELDLVDQDLVIGATRLKIVKRIVRCAATNVDPDTGARDLNIPHTLMRHLGHADCGVYAEVIEGGEIRAADQISIVEA